MTSVSRHGRWIRGGDLLGAKANAARALYHCPSVCTHVNVFTRMFGVCSDNTTSVSAFDLASAFMFICIDVNLRGGGEDSCIQERGCRGVFEGFESFARDVSLRVSTARALQCVAVCCSVLQCVAVCCRVLQCVAVSDTVEGVSCMYVLCVCCSVLQCGVVCCSVLQCVAVCCSVLKCVAVCCSVVQCAAVCCSVFKRVALSYDVLQCAAMCCSVLQCADACCIVLQRAAAYCNVLQCVAFGYTPHSSEAKDSTGKGEARESMKNAGRRGGVDPRGVARRVWASKC